MDQAGRCIRFRDKNREGIWLHKKERKKKRVKNQAQELSEDEAV